MESVKMPQSYLPKPRRTVSQMEVGESASVWPYDVLVDANDLSIFLDPATEIRGKSAIGATVTRTDQGFRLTIRGSSHTFTPKEVKDANELLPVVEIVEEPDPIEQQMERLRELSEVLFQPAARGAAMPASRIQPAPRRVADLRIDESGFIKESSVVVDEGGGTYVHRDAWVYSNAGVLPVSIRRTDMGLEVEIAGSTTFVPQQVNTYAKLLPIVAVAEKS